MIWVVDPDGSDVTVYQRGLDPYVVDMGQELTGDAMLPEFRCPVAEFFYSPDEQEEEAAAS